jgi:hypothetical protein
MIDGAKALAFSNLDPAMSDHAAGELEDAIDRLMEMVSRQIIAVLRHREGSSDGAKMGGR